jgi:hypothetical protein
MKRIAATQLFVLAAAVSLAQTAPPDPVGKRAVLSNATATPPGRAETRWTLSPASVAAPTACAPTDTVFCANNGRFAVQVVFSAPSLGITDATAQTTTLTGDTGSFWFFSPNNVELVVKVVDGRAFNGFFWVFYGALSNVAYTVTVTDTLTGAVKIYENPAGELASVADTAAFSGASSCTFTVSAANPASFAAAGGSGTISVTTQEGCSWNAVSDSPFITIVGLPSDVGSGSVTFNVASNTSAASRTGTLSVAGQTVSVTQAGTSPGQLDGSWSGTTSQTCAPTDGPAHLCALRWVISNNAFARLQVGFAGPSCGVLDGFTTVAIDPPQPIIGNTFQLTATATSPGVTATIMLNGRFDTANSSTGSGSVRLTTSSPQPDCSTTVPIGFTTVN